MFWKKKTSGVITDRLEIEKLLTNNVEEIIGVEKLRKKLFSGRKLRIKFGVDVTRPDIHIGHAVGLRKLREFQKLGHTVIFLIGDATTRIGDPSGRDKIEIRHNSEWFDKMSMFDFIKLLTFVTHSQIINREAFQKRIKEGKEIFAHELIYPILQGYDSVVLKADAAVHADQLFNEHFGRMYQEKFKQEPQSIITVSTLV